MVVDLRCAECDRTLRDDESYLDEWRAAWDGDEWPEFCPECWRREFGEERTPTIRWRAYDESMPGGPPMTPAPMGPFGTVVPIHPATEVDEALPISPRGGARPVRDPSRAVVSPLPGVYRATLEHHKLDTSWMTLVRNSAGDVLDGGIGDDPQDALLELYEWLLPPSPDGS